jgi:hypothetical protein
MKVINLLQSLFCELLLNENSFCLIDIAECHIRSTKVYQSAPPHETVRMEASKHLEPNLHRHSTTTQLSTSPLCLVVQQSRIYHSALHFVPRSTKQALFRLNTKRKKGDALTRYLPVLRRSRVQCQMIHQSRPLSGR